MRSRYLLFPLMAILFVALSALPVAAQTAQPNAQEDAVGFTRFAHTAADVGPIDIYLGNSQTPVVSNLSYGQVTDFMALPTTLSGYTARAAGSGATSDALFKLNWGVKANKSEMIVASGLAARKAFLLEPLTLVRNDTKGQARVRIFNTVWGGALLSVTAKQGAAFSKDQKYLGVSADADVAPGSYDLDVTDGTGKVLASAPGVKLEADKVYVMLLTGGADGNPPLKVLPVISDQETTRVQIVNQTGNAVDVYVKGTDKPFATGLLAGKSSDFISLPSSAVTLVIRQAGSSAKDKEVAFIASQLRPGRDTIITVADVNGTVQMAVTSDKLTNGGAMSPVTNATMSATMAATMRATMSATATK